MAKKEKSKAKTPAKTKEKTKAKSQEETEAKPQAKEAGSEQSSVPQFGIERFYVKDLSFETPMGAAVFSKPLKPRVDLDINSSQSKLAEGVYEVVLSLTITVKDSESDEVVYLLEIQQAGSFRVQGLPDQELRRVLATVAPATLFPYARETVDSLAVKANFPPLRLAPINFDMLLANAIEKQKKAGQKGVSETVQ